jgi:hypothetical protein
MPDVQLANEVMTLIVAGHETRASMFNCCGISGSGSTGSPNPEELEESSGTVLSSGGPD